MLSPTPLPLVTPSVPAADLPVCRIPARVQRLLPKGLRYYVPVGPQPVAGPSTAVDDTNTIPPLRECFVPLERLPVVQLVDDDVDVRRDEVEQPAMRRRHTDVLHRMSYRIGRNTSPHPKAVITQYTLGPFTSLCRSCGLGILSMSLATDGETTTCVVG